MGAAVQAGIIAGEITDLILLDVTPIVRCRNNGRINDNHY
jgi:hypothetical protein